MIGKKAVRHIMLTLFTLLVLLIARQAGAQSISIQASVDKTELGLDDQLTLSVVIKGSNIGSISDPELPELPNFSIVNSYQGSNFSWINGKISVSKTIKYILRPEEEGTFTIAPIKISLANKTYQTDPITVTVGQASPQPPSHSFTSPRTGRQQPKSDYQPNRGNIFITNTVDKNRAYVNEQIILTFSFYSRIDLWQNPTYNQSPLQGFWVEDLEMPSTSEIKVVNGRRYRVQEIKRALFPMSPGEYTIGAATLSYQTGIFSRPRQLKTDPIVIEVLPLPEQGKPKNFGGAVGEFSLSARVEKRHGRQNEPIVLKASLKGMGHLESLPEPTFSDLDGFQKYDTTVNQNIIKKNRIEGEKTFDFLLIPRKAGELQIPSLQFSFFNPNDQRYHTLTTDPILVSIAPGQSAPQKTASVADSSNDGNRVSNKQEVTLNQRDIRYIKTSPISLKKDLFLFDNRLFLSLFFIPALVFLTCFFMDRRAQKLQTDQRYARLKRAHRLARKKLSQARGHNQRGEEKEFYAAISKSLTEYVADKINVQAAGLTSQQMIEQLKTMNIPEETLSQLQICLDECDYARFAPTASKAQERANTLATAERVILDLEKATRGKKKGNLGLLLALFFPILFLLCLPSSPSMAGEKLSAIEQFQEGNKYYQQKKYTEAIQQYLGLIREGYQDPAVFYNLGNAWFKKGELGKAILFYEKAKRLLPRDDDIKKNLAYANSLTVDRIEAKPFLLLSFWKKFTHFLTINELTLIFTGIYLALVVLGILLIRKKILRERLIQVLTPFLALLILVGGILFYRIYELKASQCGVIISKVVKVKSGPEDNLATLFSLHEGTTFSIQQQRGDWLQITIKNGLIGWVQNKDIQKI